MRRHRKKTSYAEIATWLLVLAAIAVSGGLMTLPTEQFTLALGEVAIVVAAGIGIWIVTELRKQYQLREGLRQLNEDQVGTMTGIQFERYVGAMLERRGYTRIEYTPPRNDDGIDLIARFNGKRYAIQAKRYTGKVGKAHIFPVTSARDNLGYDEAMVITNSYFTKEAKVYAHKSRCELVDHDELARWRADVEVKSFKKMTTSQ